jgi:hypothetical protein
MFNFRRFLAYLELPKNELKRLGKTGCRSRKPGVKILEMVATHPDICLQFQPNQTSASVSPSAGGYRLALVGIRPKNDPQAAK